MTVARLQREMTEREFQEWRIFEQLEPSGETRADLRMGILASVIANISQAWGGGEGEPFTPEDFIPRFEPDDDDETDEMDDDEQDAAILAMQSYFEQMTMAAGGTIIEG